MAANHTPSHQVLLSPLPIYSGYERGGPESLLQLLPQPARKIIGKLLDLNPESRATIEDLRSDQWYSGISGCQRESFSEIQVEYEDFLRLGASGAGKRERVGFGYVTLLEKM